MWLFCVELLLVCDVEKVLCYLCYMWWGVWFELYCLLCGWFGVCLFYVLGVYGVCELFVVGVYLGFVVVDELLYGDFVGYVDVVELDVCGCFE